MVVETELDGCAKIFNKDILDGILAIDLRLFAKLSNKIFGVLLHCHTSWKYESQYRHVILDNDLARGGLFQIIVEFVSKGSQRLAKSKLFLLYRGNKCSCLNFGVHASAKLILQLFHYILGGGGYPHSGSLMNLVCISLELDCHQKAGHRDLMFEIKEESSHL